MSDDYQTKLWLWSAASLCQALCACELPDIGVWCDEEVALPAPAFREAHQPPTWAADMNLLRPYIDGGDNARDRSITVMSVAAAAAAVAAEMTFGWRSLLIDIKAIASHCSMSTGLRLCLRACPCVSLCKRFFCVSSCVS